MPSRDWKQVKEIFHEALRQEPEERDAFLEKTCGDDIELRIEVESLLISLNEAKSFLETPLVKTSAGSYNKWQLKDGDEISHYLIVKPIGAGGMGEVYLAEDKKLRRHVALKLLPRSMVADRERLRRFQREALAVSALNHPNILTIFEFDSVDEKHFIASEFVNGETLRARLKRERLDFDDALEIATQIASALLAAHKAGVIHRDIKPENVMIREDGLVKVLDFGLAKMTAESPVSLESRTQFLSNPGMLMGTASYMSPEQVRIQPIDKRSDIFSFGVVLYEMLSGKQPFTGDTNTDVIAAILQREPETLFLRGSGLPIEIEALVNRCLEKERTERYQTVDELLIDLKNLRKQIEAEPPRPESRSLEAEHPTVLIPQQTTASSSREANSSKRWLYLATAVLIGFVAVFGYWMWASKGGRQLGSIAVMPFENESRDPNIEYLSDGLSESLINNLSQLNSLKVVARSSTFKYKGQDIDAQAAAKSLGVEALVLGRVVVHGEMLTVSVELVDGRDNRHLWGEKYDRKLSDILFVEPEIAREVSEKLRLKLSGEEEKRVTKRYTDNTEAYSLYLKGRYFANKDTEADLKKSIDAFQQAIDLDPSYALAYAGLASSYEELGGYLGFLPPQECYPKARAAAVKALEIDESLAEAHAALGDYKAEFEWNWPDAERELRRAIELNPNYAYAHQSYGGLLRVFRRFDQALAERRRAADLDPLTPATVADVGYIFYHSRRYDEAIAEYRKALDIDPNFSWGYLWIGQALMQQSKYEDAISNIRKALFLLPGDTRMTATLGYAYAVAGKKANALSVLADLQNQSKQKYVSPYFIALIYTGLGDKDEAFAWLNKAYEERHPYVNHLDVEPVFDTLRSDPRFQDLLRRVGLPSNTSPSA